MDAAVKRVVVSDYNDGFCVDVFFNDGRKQKTFDFNQEDTREGMKALFETLGIKNVYYQEVY